MNTDQVNSVRRIFLAILLLLASTLSFVATTFATLQESQKKQAKPNVILILTDDQGYGDLSVHGNPVLKTPKLDALCGESVRFTDFHVAPMCTPTRGELMTGISAFRNGATAVCEGRSLPRRELKMMPQFFRDSGYVTGHFGKWHLGDNFPFRPHDRGFDESIRNQAWGIGSLAEHWQNDAFDDQYWHNNRLKRFPGYNTDVFFNRAMKWISEQDQPFFVYLATTAAHAPFVVPEKYSRPYQDRKVPANFFGMIANIDANIGNLNSFLTEKGLKENTILIFMTDNGTVRGQHVFNAGMRGRKTSQYDGGHRVPFFLRWPAGGYQTGRDIDTLSHSTDLLPTLIDLCKLKPGRIRSSFDGQSLRPLLEGNAERFVDRKVVVQYRAEFKPWSGAVLWKKWRLVDGKELYHVGDDPGQKKNIYDQHPDVVEAMRTHYEQWVKRTKPVMGQTNFVSVGTPDEPITWLSSCNWTGSYADNWANLARQNTPGHWNLLAESGGDFRVSMYMFHPAAKVPLNGKLRSVRPRPVAQARLLVDGKAITVPTEPRDTHVTFDIQLNKGDRVELEGHFLDQSGKVLSGTFYTFLQKVDENSKVKNVIEYVTAGPRAPPVKSEHQQDNDDKPKRQTYVYKKVGKLEIKADVYQYDDKTIRPAVVWIHGGALINGHRAFVHRRVRQMAFDNGYVLVSIDYRLAPETKLPAIIEDLEDAFQWLRKKGPELFHIDPNRIAVIGGSAGGYLTLTSGFRVKPRPKILVALWGYGDLVGDWLSKPSRHRRHNRTKLDREDAWKQVSGAAVSDSRMRKGNGGKFYNYCRQNGSWPTAISGWDPITESEKFAEYMAVKNVDAKYPPTVLIHGTADTDVPHQQSVMMVGELKKHGVKHWLLSIKDGEHGLGGGDREKIDAAYRRAFELVKQHLEN